MTDTALKNGGVKILTKNLGKMEAERFIALLLREPFDYTKWQGDLFDDTSVEEMSERAMEFADSDR